MRNGVTRHTSDAEVIQLPQPATRGKREGTDGKCILATLSKNDRRGKSLKALSGLARPAGIEPATPAFGVLSPYHNPL
ncbi:hypothetical protein DP42_4662 [Burkholderia pseudomallei]|nr:hypothetical protein DP42_4662 [Burkholderia pseudomallei]